MNRQKYFKKLADRFYDKAYEQVKERNNNSVVVEFDAIDIPAEISFTSVGDRYGIDYIHIFDEDALDIAASYPNYCEKVAECIPCLTDIIERCEEEEYFKNMDKERFWYGEY